jgi:hypothetical protein
VEDHHEFPEHVVDFDWRFELGGDEDLDGQGIVEDAVELVDVCLLVAVELLLIGDLFVLDGLGELSMFAGQFLSLFSLFKLQSIFNGFAFGVNFYSLHFVFNAASLDLDALVKFGYGLGTSMDRFVFLGSWGSWVCVILLWFFVGFYHC